MSNKSFKILLFAKVKELLDNNSFVIVELPEDQCTVFKLIEKLIQKYPQIESTLKISLLAINQEYIERDKDIKITSDMEIAIIPPVSGG